MFGDNLVSRMSDRKKEDVTTQISSKIGVTVLARVSAKGSGLYLYLPSEHARIYQVSAGDKIEAKLIRVFKQVPLVPFNPGKGVVDITPKKRI